MSSYTRLNNDAIWHLHKYLSDHEIYSLSLSCKQFLDVLKTIYSQKLRTIYWLEYMYKFCHKKLLSYQYYLPNELFEHHDVETDHFDRDEYKDYSSGFRRNCCDRYFTHSSHSQYTSIDHYNFKEFIRINKLLIDEKMSYYSYIKKNGEFKILTKRKKHDYYDEIENDMITYHKYFENKIKA